jgi:hypothetical protein
LVLKGKEYEPAAAADVIFFISQSQPVGTKPTACKTIGKTLEQTALVKPELPRDDLCMLLLLPLNPTVES